MKRGKKSADELATGRLLEAWQHHAEYGAPIGCVTTTYTFDATFFQEECLPRFLALDGDPEEDAIAYVLEREEKLSQAFAAVLVDREHVDAERSLRWNLLSVRVPSGILHAKLTLLVWEHRVRVLVTSANLTKPGYRFNFENQAVLDFGPEGGLPRALLTEACKILDDIRRFAPGADDLTGPQPRLRELLANATALAVKWPDTSWGRGRPIAQLVATGPRVGDEPRDNLFSQLGRLWRGPPPDEAHVLSPFFDEAAPRVRETAGALEALLIQRGARSLHFMGMGQRQAEGAVDLHVPEALREPLGPRVTHHFQLITPNEGDEQRPLHAKSLWIRRADSGQALFCIGSSNFTQAGTGIAKRDGNIEVNLAYVLPDSTDDFARICEMAYPPYEELRDEKLRLLGAPEKTTDAEGASPLPPRFGAAILSSASPHGRLDLEINEGAPSDWEIVDADGRTIGDSRSWRTAHQPQVLQVPWSHPRPPTHVVVTWSAKDSPCRAIWPVNVADPSVLPAPEELRTLGLAELLEILTSTRPAYEVLARLLRRRAAARKGDGDPVDPHAKVDTSVFLMQRMRRFSAALEELRTRLGRPVFGRDALAWRFLGPLGPLTLARRLVAEEPQAAGFFLAELALTLASVGPQASGDLPQADVDATVKDIVKQVAALARAHPAPTRLTAYVDRALVEVAP